MTNQEFGRKRRSLTAQLNKWKLRIQKGGYIRGKKNMELCEFHLERCVGALMRLEADNCKFHVRADGRIIKEMPDGTMRLEPE